MSGDRVRTAGGSLKRELGELLLGIGVLAIGLGLIVFTFSQAFALAQSPGTFLQDQIPSSQAGPGPSASFSWLTNGFNVTVSDSSQTGGGTIVSWDWDFGDGTRRTGQNPGPHDYGVAGSWQVALIVRDGNGEESRAFAQVEALPVSTRSGQSMADPTAGLEINFSFGSILLPIAVAFLTFGLYVVMAIAGGIVTKAGWNLVKPRPETIRVRMKPKDLTRAFEEDAALAIASPKAAPQPPATGPPPPPPS